MDLSEKIHISGFINDRTKRYVIYLVIVMGMIAIMDQYLSIIKTTTTIVVGTAPE